MKYVVRIFCLLIPLMAVFIISAALRGSSQQDFYSSDDIPVQQETAMEWKTTTVRQTFRPVEKAAQFKPEIEPASWLAETKPVVETKGDYGEDSKMKPVAVEKHAPVAVPVLTPEEAKALIARMEIERDEARKRGFVFYEEFFLSAKNVPSQTNIQQTPNWKFVHRDDEPTDASSAKKEGYFVVNSEMPLQYTFIEPLLEHTLYRYTICCRGKGEGKIVLSQKDGRDSKEFFVSSKTFESFVYELGDGTTFDTTITPTITFQGNIQNRINNNFPKTNKRFLDGMFGEC